MRLVERTADRDGQLLLEPDYELEGWWTSLDEAPEAVIKRYQAQDLYRERNELFQQTWCSGVSCRNG